MSNSTSTSADDQREALLETLRGYKVRTAPSQLFPGQCGVVALAPIAKGEPIFPCHGELSNDVINLTFEEVASLPSHSRKLVWAFFQPNQDPRSVPREKLTFPVPVNGLVHAGTSFFCNSADGTGQEANVETGTKIDGSGYAELVAVRDIQVGEELLDSYPIWDYDGGSGEFLATVGDGVDAVELLGFGVSTDEAQEILDLRSHMASLKAKVARLEELREINEGQITGLKRQVDSTSCDNEQLRQKMARFTEAHRREIGHLKLAHERAIADLKCVHERKVADLERQAGAASTNSRLWWGCVNRINNTGSYRDPSTTESESDGDGIFVGGIEHSDADNQVHFEDDVNVDLGKLCLDQGVSKTLSDNESKGTDSSPITDDPSLQLREVQHDKHVGTIEDTADAINQDDGGDDFPPLPPLPDQVVEAGNSLIKNTGHRFKPNDEHWHEMYRQLVAYSEEHGDCLVAENDEENKKLWNKRLATWVKKQRQQHRLLQEGKKSAMTEERIAKLNGIGFVWKAQEAAWDSMFSVLIEYKEEHGDCLVSKHDETKSKLRRWVEKQRTQHRLLQDGKESHMTKERIAKLEGIGFIWKARKTAWDSMFSVLIEYKEEHGDCLVSKHDEENKKLGQWVGVQRTQYRLLKKGKKSHMTEKRIGMTEERIGRLEEIGFCWSVKD